MYKAAVAAVPEDATFWYAFVAATFDFLGGGGTAQTRRHVADALPGDVPYF